MPTKKTVESHRKFLVICRAGDNSLHKEWLNKQEERNFDLVIDYYGNIQKKYKEDCEYYFNNKGVKWTAVYTIIKQMNHIIDQYDAVWIPDDDLLTDTTTISEMFNLFHSYQLSLAQPALTIDSYFSHFITIQNRNMILRYTNFVEIMAPIFSIPALRKCLITFYQGQIGWGLDFVWPKILGYPSDKIAIIDSNPVKHTRPVGGGEIYKDKSTDPNIRLNRLLRDYNIENPWGNMKVVSGIAKENNGEVSTLSQEQKKISLGLNLLRGTKPEFLTDQRCIVQYLYPSIIGVLYENEENDFQRRDNDSHLDIIGALETILDFTEENYNEKITHIAVFDNETILNAIEYFEGNIVDVLNLIGVSFYYINSTDRSLFFLGKAFEIDSSYDDTLYNLGYILYKYGEVALGLGFLKKIKLKDDATLQIIKEISAEVGIYSSLNISSSK